jgi:putative MATE family efflux protein
LSTDAAGAPAGDLPPGRAGGSLSGRRLAATITALAVPLVLTQFAQTLMGLVDTLMVGRLGGPPLAALGLATLLFSALAMTLKAVDVACQTFTARRVGAGCDDQVGSVLTTALVVVVVLGAAATWLGMRWPEELMRLVTRDPEVDRLGATYLYWRSVGLVPLLVFFQFKAMGDGIGWTRVGMVVGVGMNVLNVALNWLLIYGQAGLPALGVAGAAIASSLSTGLAAVALLAVYLRPRVRHRFRLLARGNFHHELVRPFLAMAWPPAVQTLGVVVALMAFYVILGGISTATLAVGAVVLRLASVSFMPGLGVGAAVQTMVGQALGAGDTHTARRAAWTGMGLAMLIMGACGALFVLMPAPLLRLFTPDEALVRAGTPALRLVGAAQLVSATGLTLAGALRGAGRTRAVMIVDIAAGLGLMPPLAWLFGIALGGDLLGATWALVTWFTLYAVGMLVLFLGPRWHEVRS